MRKLGHTLIAAAALAAYGFVLHWATQHTPPTLWKPPPMRPGSEPKPCSKTHTTADGVTITITWDAPAGRDCQLIGP